MWFGPGSSIYEIRNIIQSSANPTGIIKYNVVYVPRIHGYKITLVSKNGVINALVIDEIITRLAQLGYAVYIKTPRLMIGRTGVVILYAIRNSNIPSSNNNNNILPYFATGILGGY